jgi:rubrerythrin
MAIKLNKNEYPEYRNLYRCPCCDTLCIELADDICPCCNNNIEWVIDLDCIKRNYQENQI